MTVGEFLAIFPEFNDPAKYPPARIQMYLTLAGTRVSECMWGDVYSTGLALFAAHYLATLGSAVGATGAGSVTGEVASKKVGDVQVTYATTSNRSNDAGWWNSTMYGRQWWDLFSSFGAGVVQLI